MKSNTPIVAYLFVLSVDVFCTRAYNWTVVRTLKTV